MTPVRQAMSDAGLSASDLTKVLLVGGSTRIPAVYDAVKKELAASRSRASTPMSALLSALPSRAAFSGRRQGSAAARRYPAVAWALRLWAALHQDHRAQHHHPHPKSQVFSTAADNQPSVEVNVLQGEREFARDNKSLGCFHLDGIAPAPRGVPQIEVTFDIDANGIVHVSAKDLGTGKEQNITITASTNMTKDDIDKAVKEAEQYAAEDKKRREEVDVRNNADQMVFQTEKVLGEFGDKVSAEEKSEVEAKLAALKEALKVRQR